MGEIGRDGFLGQRGPITKRLLFESSRIEREGEEGGREKNKKEGKEKKFLGLCAWHSTQRLYRYIGKGRGAH